MKIFKYEMFNDSIVGIKLIEVVKWLFFYLFLEVGLPLLFDPLGLYIEYFGYESEDIIEFIFFILIPLFVVYYIDEVNGSASLLSFFIYLFLTTNPFDLIINMFFTDFFVFFLYSLIFIDMLPASESETIIEEDVYFN